MNLTQKQESFCLAYIELSNASEAYRRVYAAGKMKAATVHRKAAALLANGMLTARIAELRGKAAEKAVLDRAWVLDRLMRNVRIAMGEERIKVAIRPKSAPDTVVELEITDRDAAAANRALELLGKADEVGLFKEQPAKEPLKPAPSHLVPSAPGEDHLDHITRRYRTALKLIEAGKSPSAGEDHLADRLKPYMRPAIAGPTG